jgi:hypothetical protein
MCKPWCRPIAGRSTAASSTRLLALNDRPRAKGTPDVFGVTGPAQLAFAAPVPRRPEATRHDPPTKARQAERTVPGPGRPAADGRDDHACRRRSPRGLRTGLQHAQHAPTAIRPDRRARPTGRYPSPHLRRSWSCRRRMSKRPLPPSTSWRESSAQPCGPLTALPNPAAVAARSRLLLASVGPMGGSRTGSRQGLAASAPWYQGVTRLWVRYCDGYWPCRRLECAGTVIYTTSLAGSRRLMVGPLKQEQARWIVGA